MIKNKHIQLVLAGLAALSIGLYFRLYPLRHYTPHDTQDKATLLVLNRLKMEATQRVEQKYPTLPDAQKEIVTQKLFNELLHQHSPKVRDSIQALSKNISEQNHQTPSFPYLLASDSYYYLQLTEEIIENGHISDTSKGSKYLNKLMLAPHGHWEPLNLHPYVGYGLYQIFQFFRPGIPLRYALAFTPLLLSSLSLIPFIYLCQLMHCRRLTTFVGSVFFLLSPIFVKRSTFGWYDNDPYNVLFPLIILALFIVGLQRIQQKKKPYVQAFAVAACMGLYALFWHGWVFLFAVLLISALGILATNFFLNPEKKTQPRYLVYFILFFMVNFLLTGLILGFGEFFILFQEGGTALKNFLQPQLSAWPDLYISVGELHQAALSFIIELTGGLFFFLMALYGLIAKSVSFGYRILKERKTEALTQAYSLLTLALLFGASLYISIGAQRFAILCVVPFSLCFVLGLEDLLQRLEAGLARQTLLPKRKTILKWVFMTTILSLVLWPTYSLARSIEGLLNPIYNDVWDKVLKKIKQDTPPNSIVNTWWPPGHFIKATAKRRVTFDGATINFPQAYWMANVYLSTDEKQAAGLLRMLNNSGNQAAEYLQELGLNLSTSVDVIKKITPLSPAGAEATLAQGIKDPKIVLPFLKLTHAMPPPSYILVYREFVDSNLQLGFIGRWPFKKIGEINKSEKLLARVPPAQSPEYIQFLWDMMGGPDRYSGTLNLINQKGPALLFQEQVKINLETMECQVASEKYGQGIPLSIFYLEDDHVVEKKYTKPNLPYSVLFIKKPVPSCVLLDRHLAQSMLIRLFFFEGKGLKYFKPFINEHDLTRRTHIYVYEIDWKALEADLK